MINVAIWGTDIPSRNIKNVIENVYNQRIVELGGDTLDVVSFVKVEENNETALDGKIVLSVNELVVAYKANIVNAIIIPIDTYMGNQSVIQYFICMGIALEDVYLSERSRMMDFEHIEDMIVPYLSKPYLPYLEYHIADNCNLNCKACEHYSGLVKEPNFPIYEQFEKEMRKLKTLISDIGVIRILGGEPLLNKDIEKYIRLTRSLYPYSYIFVVTNALLLKSMPDTFYDTLKQENVFIHISFYMPLKDSMPEIKSFLDAKNVVYEVSDMAEHFTMKQTLNKQADSSYFYSCFQSRCNNLYRGKLAACFLPFMTHYFNECFENEIGFSIPEDGAIDLFEENITTEKVKLHLLTPFERCKYCTNPVEINWETIGKEHKLSDWIMPGGGFGC